MITRPCELCGDRQPLRIVLGRKVGGKHRAPCGAWCYGGSGGLSLRLLHGTPPARGKGPRGCPMGCEAIPEPTHGAKRKSSLLNPSPEVPQ